MLRKRKKLAESRARYYTREQLRGLGWKVSNPAQGGQVLEEQEVSHHDARLKALLEQQKPDFILLNDRGELVASIETKNEPDKFVDACNEAKDYADQISSDGNFNVRIAMGVAGNDDIGVQVACFYKCPTTWIPITANGQPVTQLLSPDKIEIVLRNADGTTDIQLPSEAEFHGSAKEINELLHAAKVEESERAKIVGALILAIHEGDFSVDPRLIIGQINSNVHSALDKAAKPELKDILRIPPGYPRLPATLPRIRSLLYRLNIRALMNSDADFLGKFYEAFLRYGGDRRQLGIIFTPRHITRFCCLLADVDDDDRVYDPACGTGGFLVAAYDAMRAAHLNNASKLNEIKNQQLYGEDINATVAALAVINMIFRGDGKANIHHRSCFDKMTRPTFTKVLMNPPFSQKDEPPTDFVDVALERLAKGKTLASLVPTAAMVDRKFLKWRQQLIRNHTVQAVMTLPSDVFYPTSSSAVILAVRAHELHAQRKIWFCRITNDGYGISKMRRIERTGDQLPYALDLFKYRDDPDGRQGHETGFACYRSLDRNDALLEIIPEKYLDVKPLTPAQLRAALEVQLRDILGVMLQYPDLSVCNCPTESEAAHGETVEVNTLFRISAGGSKIGFENYRSGDLPYISSGSTNNSVVGMVSPMDQKEITQPPAITVTAFCQARVQLWPFTARGNGGSAVKVLTPRKPMTLGELFWYAAQVNAQSWRFSYGVMVSQTRLKQFTVFRAPEQFRFDLDISSARDAMTNALKNTLAHLSL